MSAEPKIYYTLEEYLALERESDVRYEFWNGEIYAMSGGTISHDRVMRNMFNVISGLIRGKKCEAFTNNMQIKVPAALPYRYADGSIVCGKAEVERFNGNDLLLNPLLIYEVLSPSTEAIDRGDKFTYYKSIPSFREYLLIAQHRPHITKYVRQADDSWSYAEINGLEGSLDLSTVDLAVDLNEIYQDVKFADPPPLMPPHLAGDPRVRR